METWRNISSTKISRETIRSNSKHILKHSNKRATRNCKNEKRICSPYDLKSKDETLFEKECYDNYTKEEVKLSISNMYNTFINIPGVEDKMWSKSDTIFDVVKWIVNSIDENEMLLSYRFDNDYKTIIYYECYGLNGEFNGIFINWIWKLEDRKLQNLCKDVLALLLQSNYPTDFNYRMESHLDYLMCQNEDDNACIEEYEINKNSYTIEYLESLKLNIKCRNTIIKQYVQKIAPLVQNLYNVKIDVLNCKKRLDQMKKRYTELKYDMIALQFVHLVIQLVELNIDIPSLPQTNDDGVDANSNCAIYWSQNDEYFEEISVLIDDYANNCGVNDFLVTNMITADSQSIGTPPETLINIIQELSMITQNKIYNDTRFKNN
jgi:hypothetical protein